MPTILITGANRGLGLEFVRQYAAAGWRVLATVRDPLSGRATSEAGGQVYVADIADETSLRRLKTSVAATMFDIVLNNAGVYGDRQDFGDVDVAEFLRVVRTTNIAPLKIAETFADRMDGRRIIAAVSSKMGSVADNGSGGSYAYRASKAALNMVVKGLAADLRPRGITTVALSPGWVRTDMGGAAAPLEASEAVAGMRAVLDRLSPADSGKFFHFDGTELPW
jgi:NAD(P)-dependent dehydrogenase (short-subunit alcohol dehydrogenase family)